MAEIVLSDNEIESLINGESIQRTLSNGKTISIRQSYMKDASAPIINHNKKVFSKAEIENIRLAESIKSIMRLGV